MADLRISEATKRFGDHIILDAIDLDVASGEFVVVVGPSGCGKSTLLRCIAGLETLDSGVIDIDGIDVTDQPPAKRGIAMVFQSYALYPHMTARENIGFPLKLARIESAERGRRVEDVAGLLGITDLLDRRPSQMSGGQRQRVAIGRALAREPRLLLLDEPLSNLDAALRGKMRIEFARLHRLSRKTTVYVTHDQIEAMTLADRIVVLRNGRIEQTGTPDELYNRPVNRFVAGFIGAPSMNFVRASIVGGSDGRLALSAPDGFDGSGVALPPGVSAGDEVVIGVRPDDASVLPASADTGLRIGIVERLGAQALYHLEEQNGRDPFRWQSSSDTGLRQQAPVTIRLAESKPMIFDAEGRALAH